MGSFSTSLSGIEAASKDLAVIANNLANLDTTAFKDQEATFQDFFYQLLGTDGAGNPTQIGAGSVIASVVSAFTQGTINSTGVPTDMAIQGNGFFIEQNGSTTVYTRAGNFSQNASGYLVTSDGGYVLGYPAVNGVISPSQTLAPIQIANGQISPPNATSNVELTMNLDASATPASSTPATEATATLNVSGVPDAGDTVTIDGVTYTFESSITGDSTPNHILIDATSAANTLTNLADAINGTLSSNYTSGTTSLATTLKATAGTTSLTLTAKTAGSAGNSIPVATTWGGFGPLVTTLTGGTDSPATQATGTLTVAGQPTAGDTVIIDGVTYTFESSLTGDSTPNHILIDATSVQNTLTNLAAAINGTLSSNYTSGTTSLATTLTATAGATSLTLTANTAGSTGNSIGVATTWGSFGPAAATLAGGTDATSTPASATATFSEPVVVYDSLGTSHTLTFTFAKTATNTWSYKITLPAADVTGASAPVTLSSGALQFDGSGKLQLPAANVKCTSVANLADGAGALNITWQLFDPTTGTPEITQVAGSSNVSSAQQNGYASGALQSFTINSSGTIQGIFSNGQTLTLGQIALANFQNTQGLQLNGSNTYLATPSAGIPSIGAPNTGGRGTIVGQSLESSNVDMTTELSNLIVAERNYQANTRAISTADQMINYMLTMQP
jgi:flagellar hook protein FlgE